MDAKRIGVEQCTPFRASECILQPSRESVLVVGLRLNNYPEVSILLLQIMLIHANLTDFPVTSVILLGKPEQIRGRFRSLSEQLLVWLKGTHCRNHHTPDWSSNIQTLAQTDGAIHRRPPQRMRSLHPHPHR
jgi:hypothetical protein